MKTWGLLCGHMLLFNLVTLVLWLQSGWVTNCICFPKKIFGLDILNLAGKVIIFQGRLLFFWSECVFLFFISISLKYLLNLILALPGSLHKFLSPPISSFLVGQPWCRHQKTFQQKNFISVCKLCLNNNFKAVFDMTYFSNEHSNTKTRSALFSGKKIKSYCSRVFWNLKNPS